MSVCVYVYAHALTWTWTHLFFKDVKDWVDILKETQV